MLVLENGINQNVIPEAFVLGYYRNSIVIKYYVNIYSAFSSAQAELKQLNATNKGSGIWKILRYSNLNPIDDENFKLWSGEDHRG